MVRGCGRADSLMRLLARGSGCDRAPLGFVDFGFDAGELYWLALKENNTSLTFIRNMDPTRDSNLRW
jgi:hypothetical protein